jgi:predicted alpha/beta-fold hydrolase
VRPFRPLFPNPHLATIGASLWPRWLDERRFPVEARRFRTEPEVQVLVLAQFPDRETRAHAVIVHGLEGSSESGYMLSLAQMLLERGLAAHRFNQRSCGGTEFLCKTFYHAGLTSDLFAYLMELDRERHTPVFLIGFSLGGNVVLKLAGEMGESARRAVAGVAAVSTPLDLAACARRLERFSNRIYQRHFVASMRQRVERRHRALPELFPIDGLRGVRTVYEFDDRFTAPGFGFRDAAHYYDTQSARRFLDLIRVPTLIIHSRDDPMIPFEVFDHPAFALNPNLQLLATDRGGHIGFIDRSRPRIWSDGVIVEWIEEILAKR